MSYMTLCSQENTFFLLFSYFPAHPTTLHLKILGDRCMGRPPTSNFWGIVPQSPRSPPLDRTQREAANIGLNINPENTKIIKDGKWNEALGEEIMIDG